LRARPPAPSVALSQDYPYTTSRFSGRSSNSTIRRAISLSTCPKSGCRKVSRHPSQSRYSLGKSCKGVPLYLPNGIAVACVGEWGLLEFVIVARSVFTADREAKSRQRFFFFIHSPQRVVQDSSRLPLGHSPADAVDRPTIHLSETQSFHPASGTV